MLKEAPIKITQPLNGMQLNILAIALRSNEDHIPEEECGFGTHAVEVAVGCRLLDEAIDASLASPALISLMLINYDEIASLLNISTRRLLNFVAANWINSDKARITKEEIEKAKSYVEVVPMIPDYESYKALYDFMSLVSKSVAYPLSTGGEVKILETSFSNPFEIDIVKKAMAVRFK